MGEEVLSEYSGNKPEEFYGKEIADAIFEENKVSLKFSDGIGVDLIDDGQSCCEHRYITCDDDTKALIGQKLVSIKIKSYTEGDGDYDYDCGIHEKCFVEIQGDSSSITLCTHNEHDGYYGGFMLKLEKTN